MAERVRVREISNKEGQRLLRMVRRSSGADTTGASLPLVDLRLVALGFLCPFTG